MAASRLAAIVTVGSELVEGIRVDTNTAQIARMLARKGFSVAEAVSVGDDRTLLAGVLARLCGSYAVVLVTGGLGPTHDDITRDAASTALGILLASDPTILEWLSRFVGRHIDPDSKAAVLTQALVLDGAEVVMPCVGTAPGQVVDTPAGLLVLLPGPPSEMGEMLIRVMERYDSVTCDPLEIGVVGMAESDVQHAAQRALATFPDIVLTVLAKPGDVKVVLLDAGAGADRLASAARAVELELGPACYSTSGQTLAQATVAALVAGSLTCSTAESCTGGMVSAALTDVPRSSSAFLGGVVAYSNDVKMSVLGVPAGLLGQFGAVSEQAAVAMAEGARSGLRSDISVSVTGIAGPDGGTAEKPVGLVWFAVADSDGTAAVERRFLSGSRESVRARAAATALDLLRRRALGV